MVINPNLGAAMKKLALAILFLFSLVIISSPAKSETDSVRDLLAQEIIAQFKSGGVDGLREYVRNNKDRINSGFIRTFAMEGVDSRNEELLSMSLVMAREKGDEKCLADIYLVVGAYCVQTLQKEKALKYFDLALPLYEKLDELLRQGYVYLGRGEIYCKTGDNTQALSMHEKALPFFEKADDPAGQGNVYLYIGDIYFRTGDNTQTLSMYEKALSFYEKANDPWGPGNVYRRRGDIYFITGDYSQALSMYEKALPFYEKMGDIESEAYVFFGKARILGNIRKVRILGEVIDLVPKVYDLSGKRVVRKEEKREEATHLMEQGLEKLEKVRIQTGVSKLKDVFMEKVYHNYEDAALFMLWNDFKAKAFHVAESMKARGFLDSLAEGRADLDKGISPELKEKRDSAENRLMALIKQKRDEAGKPDPDEAQIASLEAEIKKAEAEADAVKEIIRVKNPLYASVQYPKPVTLEELRESVLKEDEVILEYFVSEQEEVHCFIITRERFDAVPLNISLKVLEEEVRKFRNNAADPEKGPKGKSFDQKTAAALYGTLIKPFEAALKGKTVIIIPDGVLVRLPFEALISEEDGGHTISWRGIKSSMSNRLPC